jgi:hypothetical protein
MNYQHNQYPDSQHAWAERGKWLVDKLTERMTPDGRCVLELSDEPIWIKPDGTLDDYIAAVDQAIERDESRAAT